MFKENDDVRRVAIEKLEQLAALSGWRVAIEHLDTMLKVDAFLESGGQRH